MSTYLAFTFNLLDWAEALLLECQVSIDNFCKLLQILVSTFSDEGR